MRGLAIGFALMLPLMPGPAMAGEADVVAAEIQRQLDGSYSLSVTVAHADEGWEHYADRWEVLGPDGEPLGTRILAHPHVNEQPFTRSQSGIAIPETVEEVTVRAHDSLHGYGGATITLSVPR